MIPEVGIHEGVPFDEYCSWEAVNNSSLGFESPAHYRHSLKTPREDTDSFRLGRFVHSAKLEPATLLDRYATVPRHLYDGVRRTDGSEPLHPKLTRQGQLRFSEWQKSIGDKEVVSEEWLAQMQGMLGAIAQNEKARWWLEHAQSAEVSMVWDDPQTGIRCKARCDKMRGGEARYVVDLKTTAELSRFATAIGKFGYHRQGAFYASGAETLMPTRPLGRKPFRFILVVVSTTAPYVCHAAPLSDDSMSAGRTLFRRDLETIKHCRESGEWPGPKEPKIWNAPEWSMPAVELTVGGKKVAI